MPASMIIALAGFMRKVSGSSIAIVAGGPRPGITPMIVPSATPTRHHNRFIGCTATANPCIRPEKTSTLRQPHAERDRENEVEGRGRCDRGDRRDLPRPAVHHEDDEEGERGETDEKARDLEERNRDDQRGPRAERTARAVPVDLFIARAAET